MIKTIFPLLLIFSFLFSAPAQTTLQPGDLALVGLASNVGGDVGNCTPDGNGQFQGRDRVSFVCFVDIEAGTVIDITDNGWERRSAGFWGNTEGFLRATRMGAAIPAGTIITFEFPPTQINAQAVAPDGDWSFQLLGTNALNFNDTGDQLYFMQGGIWNNGTTIGCCNGDQDAQYIGGRILFGFNSRSGWNAFIDDSQSSGLHPDVMPCFNMAPTSGVTSFSSYTGPLTSATQLEWIARIANPAHWTAYPDCSSYQNPPATLTVSPSGMLIECRICRACGPLTDTLTFGLPSTGGPFEVVYTDGLDTFSLSNMEHGSKTEVFVAASTSFNLIKVTDVNGCPVYSNFEAGADIQIQNTVLNLDCREIAPTPAGMAQILASNGIAPYTLTWADESGNGGVISGNSSNTFLLDSLQTPGVYQVTVTDAGACEGTCSFVVNEMDCALNIILESVDPNCEILNSGAIDVRVFGAMGPSRFEWNKSELQGSEISGLPAGLYQVTVTDEAGCKAFGESLLAAFDSIQMEVKLLPASDCSDGLQHLQITSISGGQAPYLVTLSPSVAVLPVTTFPLVIPDLAPGMYSLLVEDADGCAEETGVLVPEPAEGLNLDLGDDLIIREGQEAYVVGSVNFLPTRVFWDPQDLVADPTALVTTVSPKFTTIYTVTAYNGAGCSVSDQIQVTVIRDNKVFMPNAFSPNNDGVNDIFSLYPGPEIAGIRSMLIFDRWGNLVFDGRNQIIDGQQGWDGRLTNGTEAAAGVYLFWAIAVDGNGLEQIVSGSVSLIR